MDENQSMDDDSFDSDLDNIVKETMVLPTRTKMLSKLAEANLEKWEQRVLDLLKFDYSGYKLYPN